MAAGSCTSQASLRRDYETPTHSNNAIDYSMQRIDEIELRICGGSSTLFALYEDSGETYNYEGGCTGSYR